MNILTQTTTFDWVNALGWTLLHSLWQSLIIFLVIAGVLRLLPSMRSGMRYAIACGGLLLTLLLPATTFFNLATDRVANSQVARSQPIMYESVAFNPIQAQEGLFTTVIAALEQNMPWVVTLWAIGFLVFTFRSVVGFARSYAIRSEALPLGGEWAAFVQRSTYALGIRQVVGIAESARITGPIVMGYFKPLILVPVGMIGGLTTQQVETILLHELAHIRRHDYLVNLLQTAIESIFFFNPFVRMLSNEIRREREFCCDDVVIRMHGDKSVYANALVRVAAAQLGSPAFALPLAGNKYELLNRIKRIMEQSVSAYSGKSQLLIPIVLLLAAFASISWISVEKNSDKDQIAVSSDTIPGQDGYTARYSRRSIITIDENGKPHEKVIQKFEGDEELKGLMDGAIISPFADTLPPFSSREWGAFADAFNKEFREDLNSLFQGDSDPLRHMEELEKALQSGGWDALFDQLPIDSLDGLDHGDIFKNFREEFEKFREFGGEGMEHFRENFRSFDNPVREYERALRDELIEDGYLSPHDRIESLEWNDESFKVNGKSLKSEDVKKYNDLRRGILERNGTGVIE